MSYRDSSLDLCCNNLTGRNKNRQQQLQQLLERQHEAATSLRVRRARIERCNTGPPLEQLPRAVVRVDDRLNEAQPVP